MENKRRKRCEGCRRLKHDVTYGPDPFRSEINDDKTPVWKCENCRYESRMDV